MKKWHTLLCMSVFFCIFAADLYFAVFMPEQQLDNNSAIQRVSPRLKRRKVSLRERMRMATAGDSRPSAMFATWVLPEWIVSRPTICYFVALVVVSLLYYGHILPWYYMLSGVGSIFVFFSYGRYLSRKYSIAQLHNANLFEKKVFYAAFFIRLAWMLLIYYIFMSIYEDSFGFENADSTFYDKLGQYVSEMAKVGNYHFYDGINVIYRGELGLSDMGYGIYVGIIYSLTANSIIAVRLLKCLWSSLTVLLIYRIARRNFGTQVARIAAIFCTLWPNFWYYCGTHLKEVEMVFLAVLFVEQADQMLRSRQFTAWKLVPLLLIIGALFTIRTPLALVAILSLLFTIVMSSSRVMSWSKRFAVGIFAVILVAITMGNRIQEEAKELMARAQSGQQQTNMEWRGRRAHGNAFAKYAGATVFAPMIFTIPFPTMVRPFNGQELQQLLNGGNYIKNILSFFTILSMFIMLFSGSWREHMLPLAYLLGYLVVLTMSNFAQSERFHQPAMPFEFMFAAYGLTIVMSNKRYQRWFGYWCVIMLVACIAWNWFKLAGRGLA